LQTHVEQLKNRRHALFDRTRVEEITLSLKEGEEDIPASETTQTPDEVYEAEDQLFGKVNFYLVQEHFLVTEEEEDEETEKRKTEKEPKDKEQKKKEAEARREKHYNQINEQFLKEIANVSAEIETIAPNLRFVTVSSSFNIP